jgi:N-acetylglutamate synthase-like GNAT family acetyltransferase
VGCRPNQDKTGSPFRVKLRSPDVQSGNRLRLLSESKRNAFWVVESANEIVGSFGIEGRSVNDTELRRMYLDEGYRGSGIAQRMLDCAQTAARALGFIKMIVSTAQIQL